MHSLSLSLSLSLYPFFFYLLLSIPIFEHRSPLPLNQIFIDNFTTISNPLLSLAPSLPRSLRINIKHLHCKTSKTHTHSSNKTQSPLPLSQASIKQDSQAPIKQDPQAPIVLVKHRSFSLLVCLCGFVYV